MLVYFRLCCSFPQKLSFTPAVVSWLVPHAEWSGMELSWISRIDVTFKKSFGAAKAASLIRWLKLVVRVVRHHWLYKCDIASRAKGGRRRQRDWICVLEEGQCQVSTGQCRMSQLRVSHFHSLKASRWEKYWLDCNVFNLLVGRLFPKWLFRASDTNLQIFRLLACWLLHLKAAFTVGWGFHNIIHGNNQTTASIHSGH